MSRLNVGLLFGGQSTEHDISLKSVQSVDNWLDKSKYQIYYIGISPQGRWVLGTSIQDAKLKFDDPSSPTVSIAIRDNHPSLIFSDNSPSLPVDIAFPVLHGTYGEDGLMQGLFEVNHLPYVGCDVSASHLGIDKDLQKILLRSKNIPVLDHIAVTKLDWFHNQSSILQQIHHQFPTFPLIVKPAHLGSSIGISKASDNQELRNSLDAVFELDHKAVVEKCLENPREIEIAILGNDDLTISNCGEIKSAEELYSFDAKYNNPSSTTVIPADLPDALSHTLQSAAQHSYRVLGCTGLSRVDFFVDRDQNYWINEINTMPGFTEISMYPKLMHYTGLGYSELIDRLIQLGLDRFKS